MEHNMKALSGNWYLSVNLIYNIVVSFYTNGISQNGVERSLT